MTCKCHSTGETSDGRVDFQYAVKIVCGVIKISDQPPNPLPPGRYSTATNVHNPSRCDAVTLRWKVAVGLPGLRVGPVSNFAEASLGPDEALEIDCSDVMARLKRDGFPVPPYVKGWVIIESPVELDVVAVYGTARDANEPVNSFHTERVEPRCLPVCNDFALDISTGVADWYVKGPGAGAAFTQATLTQPVGLWAAPPAGSVWIKPGNLQNDGDYTYRLSFKLCSGFRNPSLSLNLLADYYANVFLNGHQIPPVQTGGPNFSTQVSFSTGSYFKAGNNELTVVVHNSEVSPTGLSLHGGIRVQNGLCSGAPMPLLVCPEICYEAYTRHFFFQQDGGWWSGESCQGGQAGTTGQHRRMQAFRAHLTGTIAPGTTIEYRGYMQNTQWTAWTPEGQICGIQNQPRRMEALEIRFVVAPLCCSVSYQVHMRKDIFSGSGGWGSWVSDGQMAGTTWQNRRIEAFKAVIQCV